MLVVRGEPGVGKTALLDELAGQAAGCRVVRTAGVQSEMEFAFAGLHQLLAPMLERLERLPARSRPTRCAADWRICRIAGGAVACWHRLALDNVKDYRIVRDYPAKRGVKSSQSGNSSH